MVNGTLKLSSTFANRYIDNVAYRIDYHNYAKVPKPTGKVR